MPVVCVDASLVLMLLLPDEHRHQAEALWSLWEEQEIFPFGPPLLYAEVPSVLRESVYFGRLSPDEGQQAFDTFLELAISDSTWTDLHVLAWALAREYNQPRLYDSMYLAAAQAAGCDFWTGDRRLVNAVGLPWVKWVGGYQE